MQIIDLSLEIDGECMTCGTPWHERVHVEPMGQIHEVGRNTHRIVLGSHSGTHVDAPLHFYEGAEGIEQIDLAQICGDMVVVDLTHMKAGQVVKLEDVLEVEIGRRMLFRFDWFKKWKTEGYYKDFPYFSMDAVCYLVEKGMQVMALDTPSPDDGSSIARKDDSPVHKFLLKNGVVIIEYLNNTDRLKQEKNYQLFALPLKIKDCDGAPARIIAVEK